MGIFGKWVGSSLGFAMGGPIGGMLGFLLGEAVDETTGEHVSTQGDFGVSLLVLIAAVMKADGKVVKSELDYVKRVFVSQFGEDQARQALLVLKDILNHDIPVKEVCVQIRENMNYSSRLQLLHLLFNVSLSDSIIQKLELEMLEHISFNLKIKADDYRSIRNMFAPETDSLYKILEIEKSATDEEVKKAYRRMAMKFHPDKVSHLGEEFKKSADEKFKTVNEAYERIKKERNII